MDYALNVFLAIGIFAILIGSYVILTALLKPTIEKEKAKRNARKG